MNNSEISTFIERMEQIGDVWKEEDVRRVYGDKTLEEALKDRMNDVHTFADIIGKVINRK